ncbi:MULTISPECIES: phospholipase D-like domain-containing protein [Nocardiopsis]|jgi:cardiolipin synthase|uniref:Cardiolipin synthase B n=2 Tax=Nocardiopsis alba TaxID=53437 RepID=A0A7K2IR39_9ACTN|nr:MULTISPECIES: phospholipase D-like domain-containing protein [Nocardiopsis]AFR08936.1 phospholipase D family protein [Nocardiopsis alba ATCC BAA-2165]MEC3892784.1 phospholipase D-like domain-containing protein [Nocardiopsis sp. LDBS1602]MYR32297.1 cardiolipin synthase B [Nocardiopsis alba]
MLRRSTVMTWVRRGLLGLLATQVAVVATLIGIDHWRKKVRPHRAGFPRTEPASIPVGDNTATVYTYGTDLFEDMLDAIRGARRRILFESYIVKSDAVGQEFKAALIEAAERGVEVYVVYDGFANLVVPRRFFDFPPSVRVLRYPAFRVGVLFLNVRKSGRDHRKILTVDGEVGFVGGFNIGSTYAIEWRDTHLKVAGPAVWELENAFIDFWNTNKGAREPELEGLGQAEWDSRIRVHRNVPELLIYPIRAMFLEAVDRAKTRVIFTQAYFIPDRELAKVLIEAAERGVDVNVLVPENSNHVVADWMARGRYAELLRGGVRLWLYQNAMVHAKTATVDGRWSTIGTANVDRLSLTGNYEINVELFDEDVAAHLERVFTTDLTNARELTEEEWRSRPFMAKFSEIVLMPWRNLL